MAPLARQYQRTQLEIKIAENHEIGINTHIIDIIGVLEGNRTFSQVKIKNLEHQYYSRVVPDSIFFHIIHPEILKCQTLNKMKELIIQAVK